jgi:hypothetical protein
VERTRRTLAALALVALAAGSFQAFYLKIWSEDGRALNAYLTELPYRKVPGLREVCVEADRRTPPGARILFVAPARGYEYAFRRAQYLLAGRELIPMVGRNDGPPGFVACVGRCSVPPGSAVVWQSSAGMLLKR